MRAGAWILREPLIPRDSVDEPYLETALGTLGDHEILLQHAPAPEAPDFRIFLDGNPVYEPGMPTVAKPWFKLCRDMGYEPEAHWDLDPALILFRQVVPTLARDWHGEALPFDGLGVPEGVVCLATVQAAWAAGVGGLVERMKGLPGALEATRCLDALPLRAVVFHDDPGRREDFVGTGVDDPLLGVFLHLGASPSRRVTLAKATLVGTGGLRWSPWELGGDWLQDGREFQATLRPDAFLWAAGMGQGGAPEFATAFQSALKILMRDVDPVVEAYRHTYPAGVAWHRDPFARYLNHMIVDVRLEQGRAKLILDDGTDIAVENLNSPSIYVSN